MHTRKTCSHEQLLFFIEEHLRVLRFNEERKVQYEDVVRVAQQEQVRFLHLGVTGHASAYVFDAVPPCEVRAAPRGSHLKLRECTIELIQSFYETFTDTGKRVKCIPKSGHLQTVLKEVLDLQHLYTMTPPYFSVNVEPAELQAAKEVLRSNFFSAGSKDNLELVIEPHEELSFTALFAALQRVKCIKLWLPDRYEWLLLTREEYEDPIALQEKLVNMSLEELLA